MNVTYGSEHLKSRVSDRYQGGKGSVSASTRDGSAKCGDGPSSYGMSTLQGNWNEERFDARYLRPAPVIKTDLQIVWQSTTQHQTRCAAPAPPHHVSSKELFERAASINGVVGNSPLAPDAERSAVGKSVSLPSASKSSRATITQQALLDVVDGRHRAFPGHQPEADRRANEGSVLTTEIRQNYLPPVERLSNSQVNAQDLYSGPSSDKVGFVIYKIRLLMAQKNTPATTSSVFAQRVTAESVRLKKKSPTQQQPTVAHDAPSVFKPGTFSIAALRRALLKAEATPLISGIAKGDGKVNLDELRNGLESCGIVLDPDELLALHRGFDSGRTGEAAVKDIVEAIRGNLSARREAVVRRAFELIESVTAVKLNSRVVRFRHVIDLFDADQHPAVLSGSATGDDVCRTLFEDFFTLTPQQQQAKLAAVIEYDEFREIYADHSASVEADHAFEHGVRNTWHVSGGDGAAANTSCRVVTVVHTNGRVTKQTILNDLGITADQTDLMVANLAAQGIRDVKKLILA